MPENYEMKEQLRKDRDRRNRERIRLQNEERNSKAKARYSWLILIPFLLFFFAFVYPIISSNISSNKREEARNAQISELNEIESELVKAIQDKDYVNARLLVIRLRLVDSYSGKEDASWQIKREEYLKLIEELDH